VMEARDMRSHTPQIWYTAYPGGETRRITNDLNRYLGVSLTADGKALVSVQQEASSTVWSAPRGDAQAAKQVTRNERALEGFDGVAYLPNGGLLYTARSGSGEDIWFLAPGVSEPTQLTNAGVNQFPEASRDGKTIVFTSDRDGGHGVWTMNADGSNQRALVQVAQIFVPRLSPDGKWVYNTALKDGKDILQKTPLEGGEPTIISDTVAVLPAPSPDGKWIAMTYVDEKAQRWRPGLMSADGKSIVRTFELNVAIPVLTWRPDGKVLNYIDTREGVSNIWEQDINGGPPRQFTHFTSGRIYSFAWSPDGKELAVARGDETSDVVLLREEK
jgi:Tol biopolymer transport system component